MARLGRPAAGLIKTRTADGTDRERRRVHSWTRDEVRGTADIAAYRECLP